MFDFRIETTGIKFSFLPFGDVDWDALVTYTNVGRSKWTLNLLKMHLFIVHHGHLFPHLTGEGCTKLTIVMKINQHLHQQQDYIPT